MSRPAVAVFIRILIGLLCLQALWALTNPIFASPDETAHIARAQSFASLDFSPPYTTDGLPLDQVNCYRFFANNSADCMDVTWLADGTKVDVATDGYPPLLHIVAGIPHTVTSGLTGVYVMRLWLALITAALFAWAGVLTYRLGRWPFTGFLFAVTPMVAFVSSTVNPSGITAASAALLVATWLSGHERRTMSRLDLIAYAVGAIGMIATRRDGVFWLAVLAVIALVHHGAPQRFLSVVTRRGSSRLRVALPTVIVVVAAGALDALVTGAGGLGLPPVALSSLAASFFRCFASRRSAFSILRISACHKKHGFPPANSTESNQDVRSTTTQPCWCCVSTTTHTHPLCFFFPCFLLRCLCRVEARSFSCLHFSQPDRVVVVIRLKMFLLCSRAKRSYFCS